MDRRGPQGNRMDGSEPDRRVLLWLSARGEPGPNSPLRNSSLEALLASQGLDQSERLREVLQFTLPRLRNLWSPSGVFRNTSPLPVPEEYESATFHEILQTLSMRLPHPEWSAWSRAGDAEENSDSVGGALLVERNQESGRGNPAVSPEPANSTEEDPGAPVVPDPIDSSSGTGLTRLRSPSRTTRFHRKGEKWTARLSIQDPSSEPFRVKVGGLRLLIRRVHLRNGCVQWLVGKYLPWDPTGRLLLKIRRS